MLEFILTSKRVSISRASTPSSGMVPENAAAMPSMVAVAPGAEEASGSPSAPLRCPPGEALLGAGEQYTGAAMDDNAKY